MQPHISALKAATSSLLALAIATYCLFPADAGATEKGLYSARIQNEGKARFSNFGEGVHNHASKALTPRKVNRRRNTSTVKLNNLEPERKRASADLSYFKNDKRPTLSSFPSLKLLLQDHTGGLNSHGAHALYTIDPALQGLSERLVQRNGAPHAAIVAIEPKTGRILAIAAKSATLRHAALHSGFPAASLFKLVTAAAALERTSLSPNSLIAFRGGNYTLNQSNYRPDPRKDHRFMTLSEALGRSCNPVFGRLALRYISPDLLSAYAKAFGFNAQLNFDIPLHRSVAIIPENDYEFSRTAAGFGAVYISPIHAALIAAGIANNGTLLRPALLEKVFTPAGSLLYEFNPEPIRQMVSPHTARKLLSMMETTTTLGTSRHEFFKHNKPLLPRIKVAAKTGTLRGENPSGINNWFIAAAPVEDPSLALAVIVVNPKGISSKASRLGRLMLQQFFQRPV